MTQWATVADVLTLTGKTVTEEQRRQAVGTLEIKTGLIEEVERPDISGRDRYWLKLATCYQAAWVAAQADLFERNDVSSAAQDGESAAYRPDAHVLGPLARTAIKRLSWRGPRTLITPRGTAASGARDVNSEVFDDRLPWTSV